MTGKQKSKIDIKYKGRDHYFKSIPRPKSGRVNLAKYKLGRRGKIKGYRIKKTRLIGPRNRRRTKLEIANERHGGGFPQ